MKKSNRGTTCIENANSIKSKARTEVSRHNKDRKKEVAMYRYCLGMSLLIVGLSGVISVMDTSRVEANTIVKVEPVSIGNLAKVANFEENQKEAAEEIIGQLEGRLQAMSDAKISEMTLEISPRENDIVASGVEETGTLEVETTGPAESEVEEASGPAAVSNKEMNEKVEEASNLVPLNVPGPLLDAANIDTGYVSAPLSITGQNRADLESLVFNEAGAEGFIGASLVAQTIRDQMNFSGITSARQIKSRFGYSGAINGKTNATARQAVAYIFDEGGMAVQHRLFYFYAPRLCKSSFHESQNFVVEYRGHRVFDRR